MAVQNNAILAINGDYYGFRSSGYVMRNGYLYRSEPADDPDQEDLVHYPDGSFEIVREADVSARELEEAGAVDIFSFGPGLIIDGEISVKTDDEVDRAQVTNPRTALGVISPLHYLFIVSDGRTDESTGLSLLQLAELMKELGCRTAYNLDGGGSSTIWFNGRVLNRPTTFGDKIEERSLSDIIYIGS
jgi:exopolysaccharide biosynthesis protein